MCGRLGRNGNHREVSPVILIVEANFLLFVTNLSNNVHAPRMHVKPSVVLRIPPIVLVVLRISVLAPWFWVGLQKVLTMKRRTHEEKDYGSV